MQESKQLLIQDQPAPTGEEDGPGFCWKPPRRYVVAFLSFLGFMNIYMLRVNLSVAIIIMEEEFENYKPLKGVILSAFFYGYILTQICGGWISKRWGGKKVMGISVLITSLLCLITPLVAHDYRILLAIRILQGMAEGPTYPSMHSVWSKWAPAPERSRLATISFSGSYMGIVAALLFSGFITEIYGWAFIFYIFGIISFIWSLIWLWNVGEDPNHDIWIGGQERDYIMSSRGGHEDLAESHAARPPWKSMLTSKPVWAINIAHFSENWGFYTLLTLLPSYMKDTLKSTPIKTGLISSIPYLLLAIFIQLAGQLADQLLKFKSTTFVRKLFTCSAFSVQTVFILMAGQLQKSQDNQFTSIACLILAMSLGGFSWAGFSVNHLDLSLSWASILMGISNTFGTIPGMIGPILAGSITSHGEPAEWTAVFTFSAIIYLIGAIFYGLLASGEEQEWSQRQFNIQDSDDDDSD